MQQREGHTVDLADGEIAADQRNLPQGADALIAAVIGEQALAAPAAAVVAPAGAVPGEAYHFFGQAVVRHAGGDMGVVVLHHEPWQSPLLGVGRREIVRVPVAYQQLGRNVKKALKVGDLRGIVLVGFHILQIADMLARESVAGLGEAEARLLLGSAGQDPMLHLAHLHRKGHIAAAAAGKILLAVEHPAERIVTAGLNVAVVQQIALGDAAQLIGRLVILVHDRRVGEIRACHHKRVKVVAEEQHMQRRIGQHDADKAVFTEVLEPLAPFAQQHDGLAVSVEDLLLGR